MQFRYWEKKKNKNDTHNSFFFSLKMEFIRKSSESYRHKVKTRKSNKGEGKSSSAIQAKATTEKIEINRCLETNK